MHSYINLCCIPHGVPTLLLAVRCFQFTISISATRLCLLPVSVFTTHVRNLHAISRLHAFTQIVALLIKVSLFDFSHSPTDVLANYVLLLCIIVVIQCPYFVTKGWDLITCQVLLLVLPLAENSNFLNITPSCSLAHHINCRSWRIFSRTTVVYSRNIPFENFFQRLLVSFRYGYRCCLAALALVFLLDSSFP